MAAQGQRRCSAEYLRHWYFSTPSRSASVILGEALGRLVGMATTNDHRFVTAGADGLVGMPQKVLTDSALRGQGIFGKLYHASEAACLDRGVRFFLTVTNEASTPIFLGRFGYERSPAPRMAILPPAFGGVPRLDPQAPLIGQDAPRATAWGVQKDAAHLRWRYVEHPLKEYIIVHVGTPNEELGWLFLKRITKMGLPVLLLMDLAPAARGAEGALLKMARRLIVRHGSVALLVLHEAWLEPALAREGGMHRSSGFNLLVKGRDAAATGLLRDHRFDLSFGDLDFF